MIILQQYPLWIPQHLSSPHISCWSFLSCSGVGLAAHLHRYPDSTPSRPLSTFFIVVRNRRTELTYNFERIRIKMVYRLPADNDSPVTYNEPAVHVFIALNLIGGIGMVFVLVTCLACRHVKRLETWYSFCFSWVLSAAAYSLLFLSGDQGNPQPIYAVCYTQAALTYALPPTTTSTTLAILVQMLLSLPDTALQTPKRVSRKMVALLLVAPYTVFLIVFIGVAVYHTENPESLQRNSQGTYCISTNLAWYRVSSAAVAGLSVIIIIVQAQIVMRLRESMRIARADPQQWIATYVRASVFTLIAFITLIVAMVFTITNSDHKIGFDIVLSTFPLLALLVFGTQKDLLFAWTSWDKQYPENNDSIRKLGHAEP
ncbi:hypothetical protein D9619_011341 [Psilocybe cf. subviscida]|uniref:Uncharacterized protein n=1 Tax=Psilocybe cf. subviscida TaxID=2480587 RepID=A0A8H5F5A8_9AGAR|nr:hypothetical protein D9619_011341 [Psilocybe cf. subviscida]